MNPSVDLIVRMRSEKCQTAGISDKSKFIVYFKVRLFEITRVANRDLNFYLYSEVQVSQ